MSVALHPWYAFAGAATLGTATGLVMRAVTTKSPQTNALVDLGIGTAAAYGAYSYANRPDISEEARAAAEGATVAIGTVTALSALTLIWRGV
jgi:hypothetical protein